MLPQLETAIVNLAINSRDAMPEGGKLTIETGNAYLDRAYAEAEPDLTPGQYVMVAVTDTGAGISPDNLPQVFEPFFTTKPTGHGTGLGLSQVLRLHQAVGRPRAHLQRVGRRNHRKALSSALHGHPRAAARSARGFTVEGSPQPDGAGGGGRAGGARICHRGPQGAGIRRDLRRSSERRTGAARGSSRPST